MVGEGGDKGNATTTTTTTKLFVIENRCMFKRQHGRADLFTYCFVYVDPVSERLMYLVVCLTMICYEGIFIVVSCIT